MESSGRFPRSSSTGYNDINLPKYINLQAYFLYMHPVDRTLSDPVRCTFPDQTGILKRLKGAAALHTHHLALGKPLLFNNIYGLCLSLVI